MILLPIKKIFSRESETTTNRQEGPKNLEILTKRNPDYYANFIFAPVNLFLYGDPELKSILSL